MFHMPISTTILRHILVEIASVTDIIVSVKCSFLQCVAHLIFIIDEGKHFKLK